MLFFITHGENIRIQTQAKMTANIKEEFLIVVRHVCDLLDGKEA